MVLGLTGEFLFFVGSLLGLLLLIPLTLALGYFFVWAMDWLDEKVFNLARPR